PVVGGRRLEINGAAVDILRRIDNWRTGKAGDRRIQHERRLEVRRRGQRSGACCCGAYRIDTEGAAVEDSETAPNRCLAIAEDIPGKADARVVLDSRCIEEVGLVLMN